MGTLISWNPLGHPRPVTGLLYLLRLPYQDIRAFVEEFLGKFSYESGRNKVLYKWRRNYNLKIDHADQKKIRK
jgi:hypothetical protein